MNLQKEQQVAETFWDATKQAAKSSHNTLVFCLSLILLVFLLTRLSGPPPPAVPPPPCSFQVLGSSGLLLECGDEDRLTIDLRQVAVIEWVKTCNGVYFGVAYCKCDEESALRLYQTATQMKYDTSDAKVLLTTTTS